MKAVFDEGRNCWRVENAARAAVLVDGENYFRAVRRSMAEAQDRIILVGWDFDARVEMHDTRGEPEGPLEIGKFIDWLVRRNPDLHVYILRWDTGALKALFRGRTLFTIMRWFFHPRIHLKLDAMHPAGAANHHKIVVIDNDTAFCGGIDLTEGRWDTRAHEEDQPCRCQPGDEDSGPWHDASMIVQGDVAAALADFAVDRWKIAGGKPVKASSSRHDCWPEYLEPDFSGVDVAIARTRPEIDDLEQVAEIEQLYLDMIASARETIYAESQYFASRKLAIAIQKRLAEEDGPEIVIVNPVSAEGWLESKMMDTTRARLIKALQDRDIHDRLRFYHPVNEAGSPIYVHAKVLIVDDRMIRIGSSNLNNRSFGFDTECDLAIDAGAEDDFAARRTIAGIRNDLLAEHLDTPVEQIETRMKETGSLIQAIQLSRKSGRTFRDYQFPDLNAVEEWLGEHAVFNAERPDDEFAKIDLPR
ncbi:MAG: phospholipase D-like domain-containing protein [Parasphingopyxis sp.]|uniref:phospholipase D-like domain-containing protein n=1 Tax=Parasphingopyxis sp. TaxID=1920299 RepID=UPI003FA10897